MCDVAMTSVVPQLNVSCIMASVLATTLHDFEESKEECSAFGVAMTVDLEDLLIHFQTICDYYGRPERVAIGAHIYLQDIITKLRHYLDTITITFYNTWKQFGDELETACYLENSKWALTTLQSSKSYLDNLHSYLLDLNLDMCGSLTFVNDLVPSGEIPVFPLWRSLIVWIDDRTEEMLYLQMDKMQQCIARF